MPNVKKLVVNKNIKLKYVSYFLGHKVEIGFTIVGVLSFLISIGLFTGILNNKPTYLKFYGGFMTAIVGLLFYLITFVFDRAGGQKSDEILTNTETTKEIAEAIDTTSKENLGLTKQIDLNVIDNSLITTQTSDNIDILKQQINEQSQKLINSQETIDNLRTENLGLHERVAHISSNIFNTMYGGDSYLGINIFQKHTKVANPAFFILATVESKNRNDEAKYPLLGTEVIIKADEKIIYSTTKDFSVRTPYTLLSYSPTTDKDFIIFSITIVASNKNYMQYTIMKRHTDGYWYERRITFDDLFGRLLRENYFRDGKLYPKELLEKFPREELIEKTFLSESKDLKSIELGKLFEYKQPK